MRRLVTCGTTFPRRLTRNFPQSMNWNFSIHSMKRIQLSSVRKTKMLGPVIIGLLHSSASGVRPRFCTDRKSTRLNSSHTVISYAVFCLKKKNERQELSQLDTQSP